MKDLETVEAQIDSQSDEDLLLLLQRGDKNSQAWEELCTRYYTLLTIYAQRILRDFHIAEDVAIDALAKLFRKAHSLRTDSNLRGWLFTTAHHKCLDIKSPQSFRREANDSSFEGSNQASVSPIALKVDSQYTPDDSAQRQERDGFVRAAVGCLPELQRTVIRCHYFEGLSYREIGDKVGKTETACTSLAVRGREELSKVLHFLKADL